MLSGGLVMSCYRAPAVVLGLLIVTATAFTQSPAGIVRPPRTHSSQRTQLIAKLAGPYQKWLNEDVRYIITPEEEAAFLVLPSDQKRDEFIIKFWDRRNPSPGATENIFKEEHYRRLAYANVHFASANVPGWHTDRGHIYILYGPPDEIEAHPSKTHERLIEEGGGTTTVYPIEEWRYRHIDGHGDNVVIEFVDTCECGDYKMIIDRRP
jgi:GWxTD domain-containing protein